MGLGIIDSAKTAFVLVDVQEKFIPVINHIDKIIGNCNILVKASQILKIPLIVTEQYPKGLGKTSEKIEDKKKIAIILEKETEVHPIIDQECKKCQNKKAYFWTIQTRAGDEAETKFFKCTKCEVTWREYR